MVPTGLSEEDVSAFLVELMARHSYPEERLEYIDALHELATRTLLEAQALAADVKKRERKEADEYEQTVISKAKEQAKTIVEAADRKVLNLQEDAKKTEPESVFCALGRHHWNEETLMRTCKRCGQAEKLHRNIYGDEHWALGSRGSGIQPVRSAAASLLGGTLAVAILVFVVLELLKTNGARDNNVILQFAGIQWMAKSDLYRAGPGPNYFSGNNVLVDDNGRLHLKIKKIGGKWTTSEVISSKSFGYGTYTFTLGPISHQWSDRVVLGFFTWDDSPEQYHREIDIELRNTEIDGMASSGAFSVPPWDEPGHTQQIIVEPTSGFKYSFKWSPDSVEFFIHNAANHVAQSWKYSGVSVPTTGNERPRINLWLVGGKPPADMLPIEVIVESFSFLPFIPPSSSRYQPSVHENDTG